MTSDDMNTLLYFAICSQQDDSEYANQPDVRRTDVNTKSPLTAVILLVLWLLLPFSS